MLSFGSLFEYYNYMSKHFEKQLYVVFSYIILIYLEKKVRKLKIGIINPTQ